MKNASQISDAALTLLHGRIIKKKPFLKKIYEDFYKEQKEKIPAIGKQPVIVELGSGSGFIKDIIPNTITSDVLELPGIDMQFSALQMPFASSSVDVFLMLNTFHHIPDAEAFLHEMERCLKKGGRIIMIEPANTLWARFIYKNFHPEPFDPSAGWRFHSKGPLLSANGALPWIVFLRDRARFDKEYKSFRIVALRMHTPFRYLVSGGVSMRGLLPLFLYPVVKGVEYLLMPLSGYIGMFITIEVEKIE
ncbi:MAG: hypothetical protein COU90_02050 [Candidatus Ryanbacteria bacterium CG10_big_fil_rev_8_21_14_0_10_43_42]|uniref:Methyltransferase type 11 domain-containing protein n=1 Tax=Candidatus Ryanbacteria bacterium CG10_big_fil_rev_8_21_14_0_10_43_42 TaxID=1974864 RepID=A0A2M8KXE9_9BACT|nr:MAG: hypothetical protein COU90_02050 [Candidatus Ryanbacteria bacterium CG10_big_fil_rev_8_21_14_0_10_43_42]